MAIRGKKVRKTPLQSEQSEVRPVDIIKSVDFYNKHIRKEGEKVLTPDEYKQRLGIIK